LLSPVPTGAPQSSREPFGPPSLPWSPPTWFVRATELPRILLVVSPDLVETSLGKRASALIALEAFFSDEIEFDETGGAVVGPGMQLLAAS
jgi:hypothetical protein